MFDFAPGTRPYRVFKLKAVPEFIPGCDGFASARPKTVKRNIIPGHFANAAKTNPLFSGGYKFGLEDNVEPPKSLSLRLQQNFSF